LRLVRAATSGPGTADPIRRPCPARGLPARRNASGTRVGARSQSVAVASTSEQAEGKEPGQSCGAVLRNHLQLMRVSRVSIARSRSSIQHGNLRRALRAGNSVSSVRRSGVVFEEPPMLQPTREPEWCRADGRLQLAQLSGDILAMTLDRAHGDVELDGNFLVTQVTRT